MPLEYVELSVLCLVPALNVTLVFIPVTMLKMSSKSTCDYVRSQPDH